MDEIVIEPAAAVDVPRLLEIRHAAFAAHAPQAYSPQAYSPEEVETLIADLDRLTTAWDGSSYAEMVRRLPT